MLVSRLSKKPYFGSQAVSDYLSLLIHSPADLLPRNCSMDCTQTFTGPHEEDYTKEVPVKLTSVVCSPCGTQTSLNIEASVALHAPAGNTGQGEMTIDSDDENVKFIVGIQWRKC
jgi:hypothetical protein